MHSNLTLAVVLALLASLAFAASSVVQHLAVSDEAGADKDALGGGQLLAVVKNPVWLAGLGLLGLSAVGQVCALQLAPVTVVQPLGALAVPWTILLSARVHRTAISRGMWVGTVLTLVGTVAVAWIAIAHATAAPELRADRLVSGPVVCFVIALGLALVGRKGPLAWRCLAWALAASVIYGMESGLAKAIGAYLLTEPWQGSAVFWFMVVSLAVGVGLAGVWIQQGYAAGAAEIVVGGLNAGAPIAGVAFGIMVLGEGALLRGDAFAITTMLIFAAVALVGVVLLSRHHPGSAGEATPAT